MTKLTPKPLNIAVVGLATLYPQAINPREFWHNILAAKDLIRDIPPEYWLIEDYFNENPGTALQTYCKRGAFLIQSLLIPVSISYRPTLCRQPIPRSY